MKVFMTGPLPPSHGGSAIGGEATVVSELIRHLSLLNKCDVYLFADNIFCKNASDWHSQENHIHIFRQVAGSNINKLKELVKLFGIYNVLRKYSQYKWGNIQHKLMKRARDYEYTIPFLYYKKIIDMTTPDVIHAHHATSRPIISMAASDNKIPIVTTLHSFNTLLTQKSEEFIKMHKKCFEVSRKMIAVSSYVKEQAIQLGADESTIELIPNGVDIDKFKPYSVKKARSRLELNIKKKIALFTGNLIKRKGLHFLINAFARVKNELSDSLIAIVGSGPEKDNLMNLTTELGLNDSVLFLGEKDPDELPFWYNACDLFILPSSSEGLSISLLEAMSCGKPIITCYPDKGKYDAVEDGETGFLVEYGDIEELTKKMLLVFNNQLLSKALGSKARNKIETDYSWELISQKTLNLYENIKKNERKI